MKTIYELVYLTDDKVKHNVLFESKDDAYDRLFRFYNKGMYAGIHRITCSFVFKRTLF